MSIREPAVAGTFYPANMATLRSQVESSFLSPGGPGRIPTVNPNGARTTIGLVCPHAGYVYSGPVAASAYYHLAGDGLPQTVVLLGPNHRSYHPMAALAGETAWRTPLGEVLIDSEVINGIAAGCESAEIDSGAQRAEHSLEVQLPFLQYLAEIGQSTFKIAPVLIGSSAHANALAFVRELGLCIANVLRGKNAVIISSTDFTHYESAESAARKDSAAVSGVLSLDEEALLSSVDIMSISMCGALPTAVAIVACKHLGAVSAAKLAYRNSGDVTGDYSQVVGYAALAISR